MKHTALLFSVISMLSLFSCTGSNEHDNTTKTQDSLTVDPPIVDTIKTKNYYISTYYAACLSKHLPCECVVDNGNAYQVISIKKDDPKNFTGYDRYSDVDGFSRVEEVEGKYNVYRQVEDPKPYFTYRIIDDTVYLNKNGKEYKYINYYPTEYNEEITTFTYMYNHYRLVEMLKTKGFDIKEKLGYSDSTAFFCSSDMDYHNLLFQYSKDKDDWFIEEDARNFYIYKWTDTVKMKRLNYEDYPKQLLYTIKK